jgi:hypothetical protein
VVTVAVLRSFHLTREEPDIMLRARSQNATLQRGQNAKCRPSAVTAHDAIRAAKVFKSSMTTAETGVTVVRAIARLRQLVVNYRAIPAIR